MSSNTEPVGETGQRDSALPFVQYPSNLSHIFDSLRNLLVSNHMVLTGAHTIKLRAADEEAILAGTFVAIGPLIQYNTLEESNNAGNISLDLVSMPPTSPSVAGGLENHVDHSTMTIGQPDLALSQYSPLSSNFQQYSAPENPNSPVAVADAAVNRRRGGRSSSVSTAPGCSRSSQRTNRQSRPMALTIKSTQQPVIRPDWLAFLEAELPRWGLWGLWGGGADLTPPADSGGHEYHSLQAAYSAVCFLEKRVDYDSIRCRIALVELHREFERACTNRQEIEERRRIGWGVCSSTIDHILQSTHSDWSLLSTSQQKSCRAQFHDRKRYGKRWAVLTDGLGTGIVLLSSTHLAKAVHNTSITSGMLNHFVQHTRGDATTMRILEQVREVADQLWLGQPCGSHNANALLNTVKMGSGDGQHLTMYMNFTLRSAKAPLRREAMLLDQDDQL
ncbi:hypothetical protein ARSEF4850_007412 [Beauveria asiatica]